MTPLTVALAPGALLTFGTAQVVVLSAAAAVDDESITVEALPFDLDAGTEATVSGDPVAAGVYRWQLRASLGNDVYLVSEGTFDVVADVNVTAASDQRSHAEKMLALIEMEMQSRIDGTGGAHDSYTIGTRQLNKIPLHGPNSLTALRTIYTLEVQRQRNGGVLPPYRSVMSRA